MQDANSINIFVFNKKKKATKKERFERKSIPGINVTGRTSRLDSMYITLLWFSQEDILLKPM